MCVVLFPEYFKIKKKKKSNFPQKILALLQSAKYHSHRHLDR
jgi:hypothetical protein